MKTVWSLFSQLSIFSLLLGQTGVLAAGPFDDLIIGELENIRTNMSTGWPELGIPPLDPLEVDFVNISVATANNHLQGFLANLVLENLSTFTIDEVHSSLLLHPGVKVNLSISELSLVGLYNLDGFLASVVPVYGAGPFKMQLMNVVLFLEVDLLILPELSVKTVIIDIDTNKTLVDFEGIMGGGEASDFFNGVLSSLGPEIFEIVEGKVVPQLEEHLKELINNALHPVGGQILRDDSVNHFFDFLFANIRQEILELGLDPRPLAEDSDNFTVSLFGQTIEGWVKLGDGHVAGLASLHRAGDMNLQYLEDLDKAIIGGTIGLTDLEVEYGFRLNLGLFKEHLQVALQFSSVSLAIQTGVSLHPLSVALDLCAIPSLGPLHIKISGAGPVDSPVENLLVNALLPLLQEQVQRELENVVCGLLTPVLARVE
ncbi:uncharacterized protein LOC143029121 [Oratosquilla oratoria]|uniref:uncharacterized protein LOC143029121 n=1 Tax=Oratosquilla oratoria TaxID=337810 RepID=UPI003F7745D7